MRIAVYCSARDGIAAAYRDDAVKFAQWMGHGGHDLIYGGLDCGLMGVMGREVTAAGGRAVGVVPQSRMAMAHRDNTVNIYVSDLHERKAVMDREADVHVALAGGVGTLDEVVAAMVAHIFERTHVDIYLLNRDGIYTPLMTLIEGMAAHRLASTDNVMSKLHLCDTVDDLIAALADR